MNMTQLHADAVHDFGSFVSQFLINEGFATIEEALDCHKGDDQSLWAAIEEAREEHREANGPFGVGA